MPRKPQRFWVNQNIVIFLAKKLKFYDAEHMQLEFKSGIRDMMGDGGRGKMIKEEEMERQNED